MCSLEKRGNIFFLNLNGDDEHRLNPTLIASLRSALSDAKSQSTRGSVLITTAQGKYFSNGMDFKWAQAAASASASKARPLQTFLELSMPTIPAVTGHTSGSGLILAMSHDYVLMRGDRGVLYASELDIGMTIPDDYMAFLRSKVVSVAALRHLLLRARKIKAEEAVAMGIVHSAHGSVEGTVEAAVRLGDELGKRKWDGKVYAEIRKGMYPEIRDIFGLEKNTIVSISSRL
ncbi:enoyl-CoA delta isomerase 2, peroxisomal-like [Cornus florida]|uniref:enoyl-CoA delta isomerase 2, peroxisomal-like n=1 Tax=Cornus florida TaxID=4283 RepID=UPI00289F5DE2|nr:enoyl-CoA delta isomerase 2, peroxisomal-like [Cornus florida]